MSVEYAAIDKPAHDEAERSGRDRTDRTKVRSAGGIKNLVIFTRQLHVLFSTGTPLVDALGAMERQNKAGPWRDIVADVRRRVEEGASLSESMQAHGEQFDATCCSMVAAGEAGGDLAEMLKRLSVLLRKRLRVRNAVLGALIYPCLLTVVATSVLTLLLVFVVPNFAKLFATLDSPLPPTTSALIAMSDAVKSYWWLILGGLVAGAIATKEYLAGPSGKARLDDVLVRLPVAGRITRNFATTGMIRMLGTLLVSHVPVLDAIRLTRDCTNNNRYKNLLTETEDAVARGEAISSTFADEGLIDPAVYESIHTGEKNGQIGPMMLQMADLMDEENEVVLRTLTSIIEPAILIVMGLLVGFVALSMFMPLLDMTAVAGGGG